MKASHIMTYAFDLSIFAPVKYTIYNGFGPDISNYHRKDTGKSWQCVQELSHVLPLCWSIHIEVASYKALMLMIVTL